MIRTSESESGGVLVRSRLMVALTLVVLVVATLALAGCVESSEEEAQTPSGASTVVNSAKQTDSEGNFITAPAATSTTGRTRAAWAPSSPVSVPMQSRSATR